MKVEIIEAEACAVQHMLVSIPPYMSIAQSGERSDTEVETSGREDIIRLINQLENFCKPVP